MMSFNKKWQLLIVSIIAPLILPMLVLAADVDDVVSRLRATYLSINEFSATFSQESDTSIGKQYSQGLVYLKRPEKMRWEYTSPTDDLIVSDGKTIWIYQPDLNQVIEGKFGENFAPLLKNILTGISQLRDDFDISIAIEKEKSYTLKLLPKGRTFNIKMLYMEIDKETSFVKATTVIDHFNNKTTVRFDKMKVNLPLKNELFKFKAPEGVEVMRQE